MEPCRTNTPSTDAAVGCFPSSTDDWSFVISGVSETAWSFSVSGYPILHRWLRARNGQRVDAALQREILDVVARIEELLHLFREADPLLEQAVRMSISRKQLTGGG